MQTEPPFRNFASDVDFEGNRPTPFMGRRNFYRSPPNQYQEYAYRKPKVVQQFTANPQVVPRSMSCRKCGHHKYNSGSRCPANQKRCLHCGEFCHFRSVCYNLRRWQHPCQRIKCSKSNFPNKSTTKRRKIHKISCLSPITKNMVTVKTGNTLIHTLLDTGSSISCLQYEFYENSDLADIPLNPSRLRFRTASGKILIILWALFGCHLFEEQSSLLTNFTLLKI